jgi:hypothetical protein
VVEEASALNAGFPPSLIDGPENRVRIPTLKHWEINSWFETADGIYGGLTPRDHLRNPKIGWQERVKIGQRALVKSRGAQAVKKLKDMSVDQLVEFFTEIGVHQDRAVLIGETANYNRLYDQKAAVVTELKAREGDQRRALLRLYNHPSMQVQLNAATATLALAPEAAIRVLQSIEASRTPDHALRAGMTLSALDQGIFKPT